MTPEQKIKSSILYIAMANGDIKIDEPITADNINELYDSNNEECELQDSANEMRNGHVETEIPSPLSRHYESKSVAAQTADGSWVGWTYWYGGGKHGEPEAIDWMSEAYNLDCVEEVKTVTVQTFTRKEEASVTSI